MARLRIHGLFTVLACLIPINAAAQDAVEAFYRGKSLTITVGSAAGGGFDAYARLVSRHLGCHVPGHPNDVVQNIPGAGSNRAASYVALQAPKDGTAIGARAANGAYVAADLGPARAARSLQPHRDREHQSKRLPLPCQV